jgi:hypothetical protein
MIEGRSRTEAEYRAISMDSSSSLKEFSLDRRKYYKKYILNEQVAEDDSKASIMGRLVEILLMEPEKFDEKFYMSSCVSAPSGMMMDFVEALYEHTVAATNDDGDVCETFEELSKKAYADSGYKIKYEKVISNFVGSDAEIYYNEIRKVRANGLTVVTTEDVTNAERIVEELKINEFTSPIVNVVDSKRYTVFNQLQIEGYTIKGHLFKSMMDKVIIDHEKKTIQVYDLKCTWSVENFYEEYYLYRRAYIQAYLYYVAADELRMMNNDVWSEYEVLPPKFIVCDSTNYYAPLVYELSFMDLKDAYEGFTHKGRTYPGVESIIDDLKFALQNKIWNISRENYENGGIVKLKKQ